VVIKGKQTWIEWKKFVQVEAGAWVAISLSCYNKGSQSYNPRSWMDAHFIATTAWDTVPVLGVKTHSGRRTLSTGTKGFRKAMWSALQKNSHGIDAIPIMPSDATHTELVFIMQIYEGVDIGVAVHSNGSIRGLYVTADAIRELLVTPSAQYPRLDAFVTDIDNLELFDLEKEGAYWAARKREFGQDSDCDSEASESTECESSSEQEFVDTDDGSEQKMDEYNADRNYF